MLKLLQGYYHFLSLGKFMEQVILRNNLSDLAMNLPIKTWKTSSFLLKESLIKNLLVSLHQHPDKRNVYGYLTEISAFKGIFSVMREVIENDASLREFLKTTLQDQYFPFEIQRDFILSPKFQRVQKLKGSAEISLDFVYAKYISQRKGSTTYGIHFKLDFAQLKPWIGLEHLISWHDLYLLAELCFNLSQLVERSSSNLSKETPKKTPKKTSPQLKSQSKKKKTFQTKKGPNKKKTTI